MKSILQNQCALNNFQNQSSPTSLISWGILLVCLMAMSARANTSVPYDPSLGTLPSAQGFTFGEAVAPSPPPSVISGVLNQGPTSFVGIQWFHRNDVPFNFNDGFTIEATLKVISSTYIPDAGGPSTRTRR